jgi:hypothetical protein
MDGWIERIKRLGVTGVASVAGMAPRGRDRYSPCPACGTARLSDGRAPVVVGSRGGFECQVGSCKASGDAVDVLSWKIAGKRLRDASPDDRARVKAAAEEARIIDGDDRGGGGGFAREPRLVASVQPKAARMVTYRSARGGAVTVNESASGGGEGRISGRDFTFHEGLAEEAIARLWEPEAAPALAYLRAGRGELPGGASGRRLPDEAIRVWKLGAWRHPDGGWWVTIPLLDPRSGDVVNVKFRRVPLEDGSCPKPKYMACPGRPLTLFGARSLSNDLGATVLIVEGELDVVAFWCFGYEKDVVSGTSGASSWEESWLDVLEPYDAFTTVYDDDEAGQEGKGKTRVIEALGKDRCAEAKLPRKDAGECWLDAVAATEIDAALARAKPIVGMRLTSLVDAFDDFERRQSTGRSAVQGFPTYCAPLDALFGSWPCGLTVITGYPGRGKTSFATWAAVEQARHGTPAILTSFEQGGDGSLAKILRQFLGKDYSEASREEITRARAMFSSMPLILADRDGKADIDELLWTIKYSIRRLGGKFWVIDHLGYLINHESRVNEVAQIDKITQALATLGRSERVAICLLAHVRANSERFYRGNEQRPRLGQLRGSSSIEGECALGLVVEKEILNKTKEYSGDPGVIIYNDKQRSEWGAGEGSKCTLYYDPIACVYSDRWELLPNADRGRALPIGGQEAPPADTPPPRSSTGSARSARRSPTEGGTTP